MLENEEEIRLVDGILKALRPLRLDWLEALVFYQHYWAAVDLPTVSATLDIPLQELVQARRRLVTKAAMLLGYIPPDDSIGPLTICQKAYLLCGIGDITFRRSFRRFAVFR